MNSVSHYHILAISFVFFIYITNSLEYEKLQDVQKLSLLTFDGAKSTTSHNWKLTNDPVMGGVSHSLWDVNKDLKIGEWKGTVEIVPSLNAPGFCNLMSGVQKWNDASEYTHLLIVARSNIPYSGFKVSFAADTLNLQFKCFKADFSMLSHGDWEYISIPFTDFSNKWSTYTGEPIVKCKDDISVCPTKKNLRDIEQFGFWMEGVQGDFHFEIESIQAVKYDSN